MPPLLHPCPIIIKKTTIKDLEKRDKELNKSIASLLKQLDKLNFEKAKIECCLDYFQTDQDNFMETVENYHATSTPQSSPPPSPKSHSPVPLPVCLDLPFSKVWLQVSYHLYQQTIHGHGVTIPSIPTHFIILPLVVVGQMNLTLLSPNLLPCLVGRGHPPPIHIIPVLLIHHLHQENPGTLSQPTEANVYAMIASMGVVACGKYTAVLYSCYFGCTCFPLIFGVTFLNFSR